MSSLALVASLVIGYLIGALPTGYVVGRLRGVDPRAAGSGRTGATNALRTLGRGPAVLVLLLDVVKGAAAALAGAWLAGALDGPTGWGAAVGGVAAVVGHVRSIFIGFGGGRGVATGGGALLVLAPITVLLALPIMIAVIAVTRYVSLGSIVGAATVAVVGAIGAVIGRIGVEAAVAAVLVGLAVTVAHADNIQRLVSGTERRLGRG